jgi:hypothetical protein
MLVPLVMWENKVITEAANDEFLTYIPKPVRIRVLTLALAAVMELNLPMTALKTAAQVAAGDTYHLVFSFPGLGLGGCGEPCILSVS